MSTKRKLGLKDFYVAKVLKNTPTEYVCEKPTKLFKAIKGKIKVKKSNEKLYSDSEIEDTINQFDSVEVELEGDHLNGPMTVLLNGATLEKGVLIDNINDEGSEVAIMFRDKRANGKYEFQCLYCGKFGEEDDDEHETSAEKIKTQTKSIKGTFYGRQLDGDYRSRIFEDELADGDTDAAIIITKWFSEVPNQVPASTINVAYTGYTTGIVSNISLVGVTFNTTSKEFIGVPSATTTFTFKLDSTAKTATLANSVWSFA